MNFYKYHGAGNDFILVDNREGFFPKNDERFIKLICHRHLGIGADGVILLENDDEHEFKMVYFNSNGRAGTMCGNGGRCIVKFASDLGVIAGEECVFSAVDGTHHAIINGDQVKLEMVDVDTIDRYEEDYVLNTGSPHYVRVVNNLSAIDIYEEGFSIRHRKDFAKEGINVNFVQAKANTIEVGTFERGVEDVTMACGTGVVAAALALHKYDNTEHTSPQIVETAGGILTVYYKMTDDGYTDIFLEGPVTRIFKGEYFAD